MVSPSGRFVIAYNGEIYNHRSLRRDLPAASWRGHSDTETLLAAIEEWGLEDAVSRSVGMFAFALWDRKLRELTLVRDRLGIKPLCFGYTSSGLVFASELSALRCDPNLDLELNRDALALFLRFNSIPAPHTIYKNAFKVLPGTMLRFRAPRMTAMKESVYWSAADVAVESQAKPFLGTPAEAVDFVRASDEPNAMLVEAARHRAHLVVDREAFYE